MVLRCVEAGVKGMVWAGYGAEQGLQGERSCQRNGCRRRVTMQGSVNRRRIRGLGHESEAFCSVQVNPFLEEVREVCMLR